MRYTYLNWGFHAWGTYAVVGLSRVTLYPILGDRVKGLLGVIVDLIAVFATVFGVAASLGLGVAQINSGLSFLIGIQNTFWIHVVIIVLTTILFILSASTGINRGIKYLSNANMVLAIFFFGLFFIVGPMGFILDLFTTTSGEYIQNLPSMSLRMAPFNEENAEWLRNWTIFFMAWWMAWLLSSTGIYFDLYYGTGIADLSLETALFYTFQQLPLSGIMSVIASLLIVTFFVTSADSATFVLGMQTTYGGLNPPNFVKVSWGVFLAASAIILMGSGGLGGLQTAIIVSAFPLTMVLLVTSFALIHA